MPQLFYRVEAPGVNILQTVSDEIIEGLLDELDLTKTFANAVYPMSSFMATSQYDNGQGDPTLAHKNRCDVEIAYIMDKSQVPWPVDTPYTTAAYGVRADKRGYHTPILIDEKADIIIEHYTVACAIDMTFTMTFSTFDVACKAFDTIQTKYKGTLIQKPFDLSFSYPVSMALAEYIFEVYKAKTDYASKTLLDYINDMKKTQISFDVRKAQLTSPNADRQLMIRCQQLNCLGLLTMDQKEPDVNREENLPASYTISFTMQVQFGRPNLIVVNTPVSVDNTVLPYSLFENLIINFHDTPYAAGFYQDLMCNEFMRRSYGNYTNNVQIIRLPKYDDWIVKDARSAYYEYRPFLIGHFTLDGPVTTIDLKQLDDVQLHPTAIAILKEMGSSILEYGGIFNVAVYAGGIRLDPVLLSVDANLILSITSDRKDKVYHLVLSESTNIFKMDKDWDQILVKYRYFFPLTIEKNLDELIKKRFLDLVPDDSFLNTISVLQGDGRLKALLAELVALGEDTNEIYQYTQNPSQLADYLAVTKSQRTNYVLPTGTDAISVMIQQFYQTDADVADRSLFIAFVEQCLINGYMTLDTVPMEYIEPNRTVYGDYVGQGGYYGFNTPLRVLSYNIRPERRTG